MSGGIVQIRPTIGYSFEQLSVTASVQVLTPAKYSDTGGGALVAFITLDGGDIRYTYDGTTPTSSVGHLLRDGGTLILTGQNQMSNFRCYQSGNSGSTLSITYERE